MTRKPKEKSGDPEFTAFIQLVGRKLREARESRGLTQAEVAQRCGVQQPWIFTLESGSTNWQIESLWKVVRVLDMRMEDLLSADDDRRMLLAQADASLARAGKVLSEALLATQEARGRLARLEPPEKDPL